MVLTVFLLSGCSDSILNLTNPNAYDTGTFFTNEQELEKGVNAVYGGLYFEGLWIRDYYFIFDLLGNDAQVATALQGELAEFAKYTFNPTHGKITNYWRSLYRIVMRANLIIDRSEAFIAKGEGDIALVKRFVGEAKFLRAYAYFELVNQFGRIPLKKKIQDLDVILTPRCQSVEEVYQFIEQDLAEAITVLPEKAAYSANDTGRATKGAAIALLGKHLLYKKDYAGAEAELAKLAGMGYDLLPAAKWDWNFSERDNEENNIESVFEVQCKFVPGTNTWYMFGGQEDWGAGAMHTGRPMEYGFNDWQNVYISTSVAHQFKYSDGTTDPRAALTFYGQDVMVTGDLYFCEECTAADIAKGDAAIQDNGSRLKYPLGSGLRWRKYQNYERKFKENVPESSNNGKVIRYADVLLMLAEAQINNSKVQQGMQNINKVRARIGAVAYPEGVPKEKAMEYLKLERTLELAGEQSRYRDLVRWGDAKQVLNNELSTQYGPATYFQDKHVLFPIPQDEKDTNHAIEVSNDWN